MSSSSSSGNIPFQSTLSPPQSTHPNNTFRQLSLSISSQHTISTQSITPSQPTSLSTHLPFNPLSFQPTYLSSSSSPTYHRRRLSAYLSSSSPVYLSSPLPAGGWGQQIFSGIDSPGLAALTGAGDNTPYRHPTDTPY